MARLSSRDGPIVMKKEGLEAPGQQPLLRKTNEVSEDERRKWIRVSVFGL